MGNAPRKRALMDDSGRSEDGSAGGPPSSKRSKTIDCNTKQDRYNYANDKVCAPVNDVVACTTGIGGKPANVPYGRKQ